MELKMLIKLQQFLEMVDEEEVVHLSWVFKVVLVVELLLLKNHPQLYL